MKTVDIFLKLQLDFDKHILDGSVTLTVERKDESATHLVSNLIDNTLKQINSNYAYLQHIHIFYIDVVFISDT